MLPVLLIWSIFAYFDDFCSMCVHLVCSVYCVFCFILPALLIWCILYILMVSSTQCVCIWCVLCKKRISFFLLARLVDLVDCVYFDGILCSICERLVCFVHVVFCLILPVLLIRCIVNVDGFFCPMCV